MPKQNQIDRRRFLKLAAGTVGAVSLTCLSLGALAARRPKAAFSESECGNGDGKRLLVAYASKCGSTGEVAEAIGEMLCGGATAVDVRLLKDVTDLSPYQAVVVGSAIRVGQWLPEATKFVETHKATLSQVPTAYFTVCATLFEDTPENHRKVEEFMDPVRQVLEPVDMGLFAGKMDYSKLSLIERLIITKMVGVPEGDFRDWEAIRAWAETLRPTLTSA